MDENELDSIILTISKKESNSFKLMNENTIYSNGATYIRNKAQFEAYLDVLTMLYEFKKRNCRIDEK